jgi:hypothetical protein
MTKGLFALLLAGALMVPHVTPALGTESTVGIGGPRHAAPSLHPREHCSFRRSLIPIRCAGWNRGRGA